jgi:hypothetical protein
LRPIYKGKALIELQSWQKGVEIDMAAVWAVSEQAPRVAGEMKTQEVSNTLWGWSRFAESAPLRTSILDESSWRAVHT